MVKCPKCKVNVSCEEKDFVQVKTKSGDEKECLACPQCKTLFQLTGDEGLFAVLFISLPFIYICYKFPGYSQIMDFIRVFWYLVFPIALIVFYVGAYIVIPRFFWRKYEIIQTDAIATIQPFKEEEEKVSSLQIFKNWLITGLFFVGIILSIGERFSPHHAFGIIGALCVISGFIFDRFFSDKSKLH